MTNNNILEKSASGWNYFNIDAVSKTTPKPLDFVLPGFVSGTVGSLVGAGGASKSAMALAIAGEICGGSEMVGAKPNPTDKAVSVLVLEDPALATQHRIDSYFHSLNDEQRKNVADGKLQIMPLASQTFDIEKSATLEKLEQIASYSRLIILDTFKKVHNLNENDSGDMGIVLDKLLKIADKNNCAILFLHHMNKGSAVNDTAGEQQSSRGSSVLVDNIRFQAYMKTMSVKDANDYGISEEDRKRYVQYGVSKVNLAMHPEPIWFKRVSDPRPEIYGYTLQRVELEKKDKKEKFVAKPAKARKPVAVENNNNMENSNEKFADF
jgi:RecA-family ATPase